MDVMLTNGPPPQDTSQKECRCVKILNQNLFWCFLLCVLWCVCGGGEREGVREGEEKGEGGRERKKKRRREGESFLPSPFFYVVFKAGSHLFCSGYPSTHYVD